MAARYLFCLCWRAALSALPLVRPLYDPPDQENDGAVKRIHVKEVAPHRTGLQVASFLPVKLRSLTGKTMRGLISVELKKKKTKSFLYLVFVSKKPCRRASLLTDTEQRHASRRRAAEKKTNELDSEAGVICTPPRRSENEAALLFNNFIRQSVWALKVTWILNVLGR